ncbi:MAG TPA: CmcJ/NvfI family oxidoreductase [Croceibacterium sp.]
MATAAPQIADIEDSAENGAREVESTIRFVDPGDFVTRRFVSQGLEVNTGTYSDHRVTVRDGMPIRDHFTLDVHGFLIGKNPSAVTDFHDPAQIDAIYMDEVAADIQRRTGADKVVARGSTGKAWMIRTSADLSARAQEKVENYEHGGGVQPPAGEAHVDLDTPTAEALAERMYRGEFPDGPGYRRFLITSYWRTFSPPPQDVPLALCDGRTSFGGEEKSNQLMIVDAIPEGEALTGPIQIKHPYIAASIFSHNPAMRWWYFSNMQADDVLLFKFHDSDHSRTWRCPHTAFHDPSFADANVRESIEVRSVAFWE